MLSTALTPFKKELFNILTGEDVKKAFSNALTATFPADSQNCETTQFIADSYGDIVASYLGAIAGPIADAIDKYIKEIGITLVASKAALSAPNGAVTGTASPTSFTIS